MMSLPRFLRLIFLPLAQSFARRHHQHNRDNPPRNAKHGQESAQLVRPQGTEDVADEIAQDHSS